MDAGINKRDGSGAPWSAGRVILLLVQLWLTLQVVQSTMRVWSTQMAHAAAQGTAATAAGLIGASFGAAIVLGLVWAVPLGVALIQPRQALARLQQHPEVRHLIATVRACIVDALEPLAGAAARQRAEDEAARQRADEERKRQEQERQEQERARWQQERARWQQERARWQHDRARWEQDQERRRTRGAAPGGGHAARETDLERAYRILELRVGASRMAAEAVYRRAMVEAHPDHGGSTEQARLLNWAIEIIRAHVRA